MQIKRYDSGKRMSQAVVHGGFAFLAGQVADDTESGREGADRTDPRQDRPPAEKAGSDKTRILSATIWLRELQPRSTT